MTDLDKIFYKKPKPIPRAAYYSTFVDCKWEISYKRKLSCKTRSRNQSYEYDGSNEELEYFDDKRWIEKSTNRVVCFTALFIIIVYVTRTS